MTLPEQKNGLRLRRQKLRINTPGGRMETVIDDPGVTRKGLILIAHPHPLQGGSLNNKVVHTIAQIATDHDFVAVRPNFRGVGMSEGEYDHGIGETLDMLAIIDFVSQSYPGLPWRLAGFSFGGFVQHRVAKHVQTDCVILVAPAVNLYPFEAPVPGTVLIHGDADEVVPYAAIKAWADTHHLPLAVIPGSSHFFHGKLATLKNALTQLCKW